MLVIMIDSQACLPWLAGWPVKVSVDGRNIQALDTIYVVFKRLHPVRCNGELLRER